MPRGRTPRLWERVKGEITRGDKGGEPGQWSARKAQMAVQEYKRRGGGYSEKGPSKGDTGLHEWTEADWGTRSGRQSGHSGERYLPKKVRMLLTEDEYARTTRKKRRDSAARGEQFSDQPRDVRRKVSRIKSEGPTKAMLDARARELGNRWAVVHVEGRSSSGRSRRRRTKVAGARRLARSPGELSKAELYARAKEQGIDGRSKMSKDQLVRALQD